MLKRIKTFLIPILTVTVRATDLLALGK